MGSKNEFNRIAWTMGDANTTTHTQALIKYWKITIGINGVKWAGRGANTTSRADCIIKIGAVTRMGQPWYPSKNMISFPDSSRYNNYIWCRSGYA